MSETKVRGSQLKDETVGRDQLNQSTPGQAVVRKIIAGAGIEIISTGVDDGTGDVTIISTGAGTSGIGSAGTSGSSGTSGTVGIGGGSAGTDGTSGTSGEAGTDGTSGTSGYGSAGSSGTSGIDIGCVIETDIISARTVGSVVPGDVVLAGSTLDDVVRQLLLATFYPTYIAPTSPLTSSLASSVEAGLTGNITLTLTYNKGSINGDNVGGIWSESALQGYRAGSATNYIINGVNKNLVNTHTFSSTIIEGANTWYGTTSYGIGAQPKDSSGANYGTPLAAGSIISSVVVNGRRKLFYNSDLASAVPYSSSAQIRSMSSFVLNPTNGTSFTINIPIGALKVTFAYPATLDDVSSVIYIEGMSADIKDAFTKTTVSVEGANGYIPINYKVYTFVPVEAFSATAIYIVTV